MHLFTPIIEGLLQHLDANVVPWRQAWPRGLPRCLTTGQEFRGLNLLGLGLTHHSSRYWLTARDVARLGGQVRRCQLATTVIDWTWSRPAHPAQPQRQNGEESPLPCDAVTGTVFNLDQVDGIAHPDDDDPVPPSRRFAVADLMLDLLPDQPAIEHARTVAPVYDCRTDRITLPHLSQFQSADDYYRAIFSARIRASGAPHRLHRFTTADGGHCTPYSFEALVAELGTAFLCGFAGIRPAPAETLAAGHGLAWAKVLRPDPVVLLRAAAAAQRAADYLRGKLPAEPAPPPPYPAIPSPHRCPEVYRRHPS